MVNGNSVLMVLICHVSNVLSRKKRTKKQVGKNTGGNIVMTWYQRSRRSGLGDSAEQNGGLSKASSSQKTEAIAVRAQTQDQSPAIETNDCQECKIKALSKRN